MTIAEQLHEEGRVHGHEEGRVHGHEEGRVHGRVAALRELLDLKFGAAATASQEVRLATADPDAVDRYLRRVLAAGSIADVFED